VEMPAVEVPAVEVPAVELPATTAAFEVALVEVVVDVAVELLDVDAPWLAELATDTTLPSEFPLTVPPTAVMDSQLPVDPE